MFKLRKKHIISIHNIGAKELENVDDNSEKTFIDSKWAKEYCDSFAYNLRVNRVNKSS